MASAPWSKLPRKFLSLLSKLLNSDVDTLRLRAVCKSWRSSIPPRPRPSPFPLKLPALFNMANGYFLLEFTTLYRLSPPEIGPYAGDPSDGWLVRVSEVNPNRFKLLPPLVPRSVELASRTLPNRLNLLDLRIDEVCRCYGLSFHDDYGDTGFGGCLNFNLRKVIVLWSYAIDCEFAVLALFSDQMLSYWRFGDTAWTQIDSTGYEITDLAVCDSKPYAISREGVLALVDSNFRLKPVRMVGDCLPVGEKYLVEYDSELYALSKIYGYTCMDENDVVTKIFEYGRRDEDYETPPTGFSMELKVFKKCADEWKAIEDLGNVMLMSSADLSIGLDAEWFRGRRGNCVHVAQSDYMIFRVFHGGGIGFHYGVYYLGGDGTVFFRLEPSDDVLHWPIPEWLKKMARDS